MPLEDTFEVEPSEKSAFVDFNIWFKLLEYVKLILLEFDVVLVSLLLTTTGWACVVVAPLKFSPA